MTLSNAIDSDPYTMEARLCDDAGIVSRERAPRNVFDPDLTYMRQLNNLRARTGLKPYAGDPFPCTGHAHLAGEHIRCTSPAHDRPAQAQPPLILTGEGAQRASEILTRRGKAQRASSEYLPTHNHGERDECDESCPAGQWEAHVAAHGNPYHAFPAAAGARSRVQEWVETRPWEVRVLDTFVEHMKAELAANTGKGDRPGWLRDTPRALLAEIQHHYVKLHAAVVELDRLDDGHEPRPLPWGNDIQALIGEFAADVANMAMMLADRCGALEVPVPADLAESER